VAYNGSITSGNNDEDQNPSLGNLKKGPPVLGGRRLFTPKNPGSPGKLGKTSTKAESLSKLRGKGALA
jgi:hypothetical protein